MKESFYSAYKIVVQTSSEAVFEANISKNIKKTLAELKIDYNTKELLIEQLLYRGKEYKYLLKYELVDM